ncbi:asparagine synthetase B [Candidatus Bathyarchaeota archaeon]|nr:asparagine synthetase B [Candidatus Bathyarchaeota archaeon]
MGAISAVRTTEGIDATRLIKKMVALQLHRGSELFGVSTSKEHVITSSLDEFSKLKNSNSAIAYNLMKIDNWDEPQPVRSNGLSYIIECDYAEFYSSPTGFLKFLHGDPYECLRKIITKWDGQYAVAVLKGEEIYAARDPVGLKPLYYAYSNGIDALASEKKALWGIGLTSAFSFPPGHVWRLGENSPSPVMEINSQKRFVQRTDKVMSKLTELLEEAVYERTHRLDRIGICFSGGVDSAIITILLSKFDIEAQAFIVGMEDSPEIESACEAAEMLGVKAIVSEYSLDDVDNMLHKCIWRIEDYNIVKLGIAIPFSWCASSAFKTGFRHVISGQGADELFCGYHKFLRVLREKGRKSLELATLESVREAYKTSFQVVEQTVAPEKVKILHPFADLNLIIFGLAIPSNMKVQGPYDILRKRILRDAGLRLGLPEEIVRRHKKAIQYSTGVDKGISMVAKRKHLKTREYVRKIFEESFKTIMGESEM